MFGSCDEAETNVCIDENIIGLWNNKSSSSDHNSFIHIRSDGKIVIFQGLLDYCAENNVISLGAENYAEMYTYKVTASTLSFERRHYKVTNETNSNFRPGTYERVN